MKQVWVLLVAAFLAPCCYAQSMTTVSLNSPKDRKLRNVKAEQVQHKGRQALRVTDTGLENSTYDDRLLILTGTNFKDGVIELELAGETLPTASATARGFVGVAFRVANEGDKFECFYLRPTNGRADDQVRRNHSTQYISHPDFPWEKLRTEFPGKYESYVDLVPGEWTKVKIEVSGTKAKLYVHGASQPSLIVNDLKLGESSGAIGLWVGPGTVAHFSNLRVSR